MYGVEHMLRLHQERANCCWEDGAANGLRTKHLLDLHACTAAGGSSCSFPRLPYAAAGMLMPKHRGAEQLLGDMRAGKRKQPGLGKTCSLAPQLYQTTVGKAEM